MEVNLNITKNFIFLTESKARIKILEGSSRSGKTWSACQYLIYRCLTEKDLIITIARDNLVVNRRTVYLDFMSILKSTKIKHTHHKSEMTVSIKSNLIRFVGLDDIDKVHGLRQDIIYINEGLNIAETIYLQLLQRTTGEMIIDYNPSRTKHFLYKWAEKRKNVELFKSNIFMNPEAPIESINQILSYEPTEENILAGTSNIFYWLVYGKGERFSSKEVVIPKFFRYKEPLKEREIDWMYYGGDFGFTDPTTLVQVSKIKGSMKLFCRVLIYQSGLTNSQLAELIKNHPLVDLDVTQVWDSAEPKSIIELRENDLNAIKSVKGAGSIYFGIQKMQQYELYIFEDELSQKMADELERLRFETDGDGEILKDTKGRPILRKGGDHTIDPIRYILERFGKDAGSPINRPHKIKEEESEELDESDD